MRSFIYRRRGYQSDLKKIDMGEQRQHRVPPSLLPTINYEQLEPRFVETLGHDVEYWLKARRPKVWDIYTLALERNGLEDVWGSHTRG